MALLEHIAPPTAQLPPMGAHEEDPRRLSFIGLDANGVERVLFLTFAILCWFCFCKAVQFGFFRVHYNEAKVGGWWLEGWGGVGWGGEVVRDSTILSTWWDKVCSAKVPLFFLRDSSSYCSL